MKIETRKVNIENEIKRLNFILKNEKCDRSERMYISVMIKNLQNQLEYFKKGKKK